ncbi:ribonuclease HII [Oceanobacillus sp. CAU 1775]
MNKSSITVIRQLFEENKIDNQLLDELKTDTRKGVQALIKRYEKQQAKQEELELKFLTMTAYEKRARENGYQNIAGVDEAGRGPLAGPVVVAAVILPADFKLLGLDDSKKLSENERETYFDFIKDQAMSYKISIVSNTEIDQMNILEATKYGMIQAINGLDVAPDYALLDAVALDNLPCKSESIIQGDAKSISIAAASILAKVTRDRIMKEIHNKYPMYDFNSNMGYGTKKHMDSLKINGASPYHRVSFAPVRNVL